MANNLESISEDAYKVLEWDGNLHLGCSCVHITKLNILDIDKGEDVALRNAFQNILNEINSLKSICLSNVELLYLTTQAQNQSYRADIHIFLIIRLFAESQADCERLTAVNCDMLSRILSGQKLPFEFIDVSEMVSIVESLRHFNTWCLIKEEEIIPSGIPLSEFYYSVDYIKSSYNAESFRSFMHQLSNYPNVAVSFQLTPNSFDYDEQNSIMNVANLLDRVANGLNDDYYGEIVDYHARKPAENYNYYYHCINDVSFTYNIVVCAVNDVSVQIINRLKSLINNSSDQSNWIPLNQICIPDPSINIYESFLNYPFRIENELIENCRSDFWYRSDAPKSLTRLPYIVSIQEASVFFNLPCVTDETWPGIRVKEKSAERGIIDPELLNEENIKIGYRPDDEDVFIGIPIHSMTRHMFVAGMPGTGKTNFSQSVLYQVYQKGSNFIVIEPAKSEYRALSEVIPELQVFTVGNSNCVPLLINPFIPPRNVTAGEYKRELMDIFRAAFNMEGALDNLFLDTLNACYLKYGWRDGNTKDDDVNIFGLMEFIHEFEYRMNGRYDSQTREKLKTAGLMRLNRLINSDYVMFDTIQTVSIEDILKKPTVIELDKIGDAEQKSLVTTLLLNNLGSYIRANKSEFTSENLNTLILLEEAHVIFSAPIIGEGRTASNAIAISLIERVLQEMRALGVGMMIADQSPQAVSSNVIRMTEHKMVFKITERTDREVLAGSMAMDRALDNEMLGKMAVLPVGRGYFFNTKTITPELLQTLNFREIMKVPVTIEDDVVKRRNVYWDSYKNDNRPYPECIKCALCNAGCVYKIRDEGRYIAARMMNEYNLVKKGELKEFFTNYKKKSLNYVNNKMSETEMQKSVECSGIKLLRDLYLKDDFYDYNNRILFLKLLFK